MSSERAPAPWRLLLDGPTDGASNMAVDEAILDAYARAPVPRPPTLRLYGWDRPTLSLGRSQPPSRSIDLHDLRRRGVALVRRPTGGAAVLHDRERTYAVVGSLRSPEFPEGVIDTYRRVAGALVEGLRGVGVAAGARASDADPPLDAVGAPVDCFARVSIHEITVEGRKLVGSAQLRRRGAFLQHGSILVSRSDHAGIWGGSAPEEARDVTLDEALGAAIDERRLDDAIAEGFRRALGARFASGTLDPEERERAVFLRTRKYLDAGWTHAGRSPDGCR